MTMPDLPSAAPPDWYIAMRAARYVNVPFHEAEGIAYGPVVRTWALIAESAEHEAEAILTRRAQKKAS
jgi:hypothetical protein